MQARKSLIVFTSEHLQSIFGLAATFFAARLMGPSVIGTVAYHLSVLGIFSIILDMGVGTAHIKRIAESKDSAICIGTFLTIKGVLIAVYVLATLMYVCWKGVELERSAWIVVLVLFFYTVFHELVNVLTNTFCGRQEFIKFNLPPLAGRFSKSIIIIVVALIGMGAVALSFSYLVESVMALALALILFWQSRLKIRRPTRAMLRSYIDYALPMATIIPISIFVVNIGRVMIQNLSGLEEVGIFFAIQSLLAVPNSISSSAMTVLLPKISSDFSKNEMKVMQTSIHKATRYLSIIVMLVSVILIALGSWILELCFGAQYTRAGLALSLLACASYVAAVARPYSNALFGTENHHRIVWISIANVIVLIVCNLYFIPTNIFGFHALGLGAGGAALSNLVIWLISGGAQIYFVFRLLNISFNWRIFIHVGAGILTYFFCSWLRQVVPVTSNPFRLLVNLGFVSFCASGFYFGCLVLFKEWNANDWNYFKELIRFAKLKSHFQSEINPGNDTNTLSS